MLVMQRQLILLIHVMHTFSFQPYKSCIRKCKDGWLLQMFTRDCAQHQHCIWSWGIKDREELWTSKFLVSSVCLCDMWFHFFVILHVECRPLTFFPYTTCEFNCFWTLDVAFKEAKPPLQQWAEHEGQFPRVTFLVRAMSGILGSSDTQRLNMCF
jgi:hypothetical protein